MKTILVRSLCRNLVAGIVLSVALGVPARAQLLVEIDRLRIDSPEKCSALAPALRGKASGGQWLVGDGIELFGQPNAGTPMSRLDGAFDKVRCYNQITVGGRERVFVAGEEFKTCGWVPREDLLDEHVLEDSGAVRRGSGAVCATPRAMLFDAFCTELKKTGATRTGPDYCKGVPPKLRAKGVLIGSTSDKVSRVVPFMTLPIGGEPRLSKSFFSVLEIHAVARGDGGTAMALVGDGDGDLFGWLNLDAVQLWPTRLSLFYGLDGRGQMFQTKRDMISNWRRGKPPPDITFDGSLSELADFIHGKLPLLSYPIVRTIDTQKDPIHSATDPPFHEVVFLGQSGAGSASKLMAQAKLAQRIGQLRQMNAMLVVDTTESMKPYLPLIQQGIMRFIKSHWQKRHDPTNRLPEIRLSVVAYSDFIDAARKGLDDRIKTEVLVSPLRVERGIDPRDRLARISAHDGLTDDVGEFREASLEAVAQLSARFDRKGWFAEGPRIIIHIADHGSRDTTSVSEILRRLEAKQVYYFPVAVVTDDEGDDARAEARRRFERQAVAMLRRVIDDPKPSDVSRVDLLNLQSVTPETVKKQLDHLLEEVVEILIELRSRITGNEELIRAWRNSTDRASSRIVLNERLRTQYGLDKAAEQFIVQASSGFAPLAIRQQEIKAGISWTYTVALEAQQARLLAHNLRDLCTAVGRPEQRRRFGVVIRELAEAFSGDQARTGKEVRAILKDLRDLPGAEGSFLARPVSTLLQAIRSTDPEIIKQLKKDVCWVSYHLNNVTAEQYAKPSDLGWTGSEFVVADGASVTKRIYRYKPPVGAEVVYLPSWFFVVPSSVRMTEEECDPLLDPDCD